MQIPLLTRINLNTCVGKGVATIDRKKIIGALMMMERIAGQKGSITRAKKSRDKYKLREKMMIGCKVTLRKNNMFFFLENLIHFVFADLDFSHPLPKKKKNSLHYSLGLSNIGHAFHVDLDDICGLNIEFLWLGLPAMDGFQMPKYI